MYTMKNYTILAIDTSCDETSVAVTQGVKILANIISSQVDLHQEYAGVVPSIAKRAHQERIGPVVNLALTRAHKTWKEIDAIAATQGPGLAIALEVGIAKAKELAARFGKPLLAVNHMEGHLLSFLAQNSQGKGLSLEKDCEFPFLGFLISGGHTQLVLVDKIGNYQLVGETLDDAAGEAFDKVAKMLKLGYPGGPIVEQLAQKGDPFRFNLPWPLANDATLNFSFSGLKTACLYQIQALEERGTKNYIPDFCAGFQRMAILHLTDKLEKALKKYEVKQLVLGGGVISNLHVRKRIRETARKYKVKTLLPYNINLCTDNAAMIGVAAVFLAERGKFVRDIKTFDRNPILNFPLAKK